MGLELLKTIAALAAILGLIFVLAYVFKRFGLGAKRSDKGIPGWRILGVKVLAPGKQIFVFEAGSRTLLIGSTDKSLNTLAEIQDEKERQIITDALTNSAPSFKDFLKRADR